jgi:hypothetical protein
MATACKHSSDWCHVCGDRPEQLADVWYPEYAEQGAGRDQYIRICASCADVIGRVARGELETTPGIKCYGWGVPVRRSRRARRTR